jgi:hypothetical protein
MTFSYETVSAGVLLALAGAEYWRTRRGPLVLLSVAVLHTRAALLCLRWEVAKMPGRWRQQLPLALEEAKRWR